MALIIASSDNKTSFKKSCDEEDGIAAHSGKDVAEFNEKSFVKSNFFLCTFCSNRYGFHDSGLNRYVDGDGFQDITHIPLC